MWQDIAQAEKGGLRSGGAAIIAGAAGRSSSSGWRNRVYVNIAEQELVTTRSDEMEYMKHGSSKYTDEGGRWYM
jgi:hypothetical protein